ncbi:hypothetical protein GCM10023116_33190 [Kistimonas scapharcae]|uniref:Uncharacterized protein n=1 Tax=Kistimonas scapharcae TaxID=1036133 RepID=A0ABP8V6W0_9GAMM
MALESRDFDYVIIHGQCEMTYDEFNQLSLRERCKIVLNEKVEFLCDGDRVTSRKALGDTVSNLKSQAKQSPEK